LFTSTYPPADAVGQEFVNLPAGRQVGNGSWLDFQLKPAPQKALNIGGNCTAALTDLQEK